MADLDASVSTALSTLEELMKSEDEGLKLSAAKTVLDYASFISR